MAPNSLQVETPIPWLEPTVHSLHMAVLYTLAYADVFDYALTLPQVQRYLIGLRASLNDVRRELATLDAVDNRGPYYFLAGRDEILELRRRRNEITAQKWPRVLAYGGRVARVPFVRMVALTGALSMGNAPSPKDDFDYLIVTEPGRLWLARAMVIGLVVRPAMLRGDEVCPNYIISSDHLTFVERDLYTAHELVQMVPLAGQQLYDALRAANPWIEVFLPNAQGPPERQTSSVAEAGWVSRSVVEPALRGGLGSRLERWEMTRKVAQLSAGSQGAEVLLNAQCCKGHIDAHQWQVYTRLQERLVTLQVSLHSGMGDG